MTIDDKTMTVSKKSIFISKVERQEDIKSQKISVHKKKDLKNDK